LRLRSIAWAFSSGSGFEAACDMADVNRWTRDDLM
jgi:hypothetical protein